MSIELIYQRQLGDFKLDVKCSLPSTGISVLFGPSGAGKSRILQLIAGLDKESASIGKNYFSINNQQYDNSDKKLCLPPWQRNIAYVFQDQRLFPHMTVAQNIDYGYKRRRKLEEIVYSRQELTEKFKITEFLERYPSELSGGQKQRVALVRALLSQPDLLILDEPMAALDYASKQELLPYLECIHQELTIPVLYVSHDIKEVLRLADYIVLIEKGHIIAEGDIADLCIDQPLLTQAEGSSFILKGRVENVLGHDKLIQVDCDGQTLLVTGRSSNTGDTVRILIHARDVSLCHSKVDDSSILNCIPVFIEKIEKDYDDKLKVIAKIGEQTLVAMISHRSAKKLQIEPGVNMYAQFKATAIIK